MNNKATKKVPLNNSELIEYWSNFLFLSSFLIFIFIFRIKDEIIAKEFPTSLLILTILLLLLLWNRLTARNFEIWEVKITEKQFQDASLATARYLEWNITENSENSLTANKSTGFQWEGIDITAIRTENEIYFNSMVAPSIRANPFSFTLNKKNKKTFKSFLVRAYKGENVIEFVDKYLKEKEEKFWAEPEFSIKNLLIRIFMYLLITVFGFLIFIILKDSFSLKSIMVSSVLIGVSAMFIISDFKIIKKKKQLKKKDRL